MSSLQLQSLLSVVALVFGAGAAVLILQQDTGFIDLSPHALAALAIVVAVGLGTAWALYARDVHPMVSHGAGLATGIVALVLAFGSLVGLQALTQRGERAEDQADFDRMEAFVLTGWSRTAGELCLEVDSSVTGEIKIQAHGVEGDDQRWTTTEGRWRVVQVSEGAQILCVPVEGDGLARTSFEFVELRLDEGSLQYRNPAWDEVDPGIEHPYWRVRHRALPPVKGVS